MKVLLINGSPRQNGNTATAIAVCRGDEPWAPMQFIR